MLKKYVSSMSLHCSSLVLVLWLLLVSPPTTQAAGYNPPSKPILARLTKDKSTSLYSTTIKHGGLPLAIDLSGPLLWSRCPPAHRTIPCHDSVCRTINQNLPVPASCAYASGGGQQPGSTTDPNNCVCTTSPYNPVSGRCAHADASTFTLSPEATDGKNPLFPVTFMASGSCAPEELFASLPAGSWGVAGLSRLPQSLPTQFASILKVAKQFALCLPGGTGTGAAIFGGGPFQLLAAPPVELAEGLRQNQLPFLKNPKNGAYYFRVTGVSVNTVPVALPPGAFDLDAGGSGTGGVVFSTVTPYTTLRSDIYRPLLNAFDAATSGIARAPPVKPFEMCYQASALGVTRLGFAVANIEMFLDGGRSWLLPGGSSLVQVDDQTVCFAFLEMSSATALLPGSPAVIFGGFQLEDHLLLFDLDKETFAFSGPLAGIRTTCSNFNFTTGSS